MKLNIELEISEEQFKKLEETGELTIKFTQEKTEGITILKWPDTKGDEDAERLLDLAKTYNLTPSELPKLSIARIHYLLFERNGWNHNDIEKEEITKRLENTLDIRFSNGSNIPDSLVSIFNHRISFSLGKYRGIITETDLKTATRAEIACTYGIGKGSIEKIEEFLEEQGIQLIQ